MKRIIILVVLSVLLSSCHECSRFVKSGKCIDDPTAEEFQTFKENLEK